MSEKIHPYVRKYTPGCDLVHIQGFEVPVQLPAKPKQSQMRNYGLPKARQKFRREVLPTDREWKAMDSKEKHEFVEGQWRHRLNGDWWLINGHEVYVPGNAWYFFNYWVMESGTLPMFRMEAVDYYIVDDHVERDVNSIGKFVIKTRRLGETEKELCAGYEMTTRYADSNFGMMNTVEAEAKGNYLRLIKAHKRMRPWFRPTAKGDDSQTMLVFDYAEIPKDGEPLPLYSSVSYKPTKLRSYDGQRLRRFHWDEIGKLKPTDIDIKKQWAIVKETLALNNGLNILGKAALTTTVENLADGETIKACTTLWKESDPNDVNDLGRTRSGLLRYYRNFRYSAEVDEFGFPKVEDAEKNRAAIIAAFIKAGDLIGLGDYKRKYPDLVSDALTVPEASCILHPTLLDAQAAKIVTEADLMQREPWAADRKYMPRAERGDLVWIDKFMGGVKWIPNPSGRFLISQHPVKPNAMTLHGDRLMPGNPGVFTIGVDPIDHLKGSRGGSDFAMAVFRNFDMSSETELEFQENESGVLEIMNKWQMRTNRFVCSYRHRPYDPREAYEDSLKCAIYYGTPIFTETNKPGITFFYDSNKAEHYLAWKHPLLKIGSRRPTTPGMAGSESATGLWTGMLQSYNYQYCECHVHPDIIADHRNFTGENTTDCDLVVASGFAMMQSKAMEATVANRRNEQWTSLPFSTY